MRLVAHDVDCAGIHSILHVLGVGCCLLYLRRFYHGLSSGRLSSNETMMTSNQFLATNSSGDSFRIYTNVGLLTTGNRGTVIRFTADNRTKTAYGWGFNEGHHADVSISLGLNDKFSDPEVLRGAAENIEGQYVFIASDFFASFKGRVLKQDCSLLTELFSRDWSWVNQYIEVTEELLRFKEALCLSLLQGGSINRTHSRKRISEDCGFLIS